MLKYLPYILLFLFLLLWEGNVVLCQAPGETPVEETAEWLNEEWEDYDSIGADLTEIYPGKTSRELYQEKNITNRPFDRSKWEGLVKDLDYQTKKKRVKKKTPPPPETGEETASSPPRVSRIFKGEWLKILANIILIAGGAALLAFVLYKLLGFNAGPANKRIDRTQKFEQINLEQIEENLHETDLDRYIRLAVERDDYPLAVRLYYLAAIRTLSQHDLIKWKKDKTNRHYLHEMASSDRYPEFFDLTRIYEQTWYGNLNPDKQTFGRLAPRFEMFIKSVHQPNGAITTA